MTIPKSGQTVHMMTLWEAMRVQRNTRREGGRNASELELYTTDDLRRMYQAMNDDLIRLRDGIVDRIQLVAEIRVRVFWSRVYYGALLLLSLIAAVASVAAVL
jgi:hypothetical protein